MAFSVEAKLKAMAIVHIFETGRPSGRYGTCVVLNDGAGVSYGKNQFTHRSGSLYAVVSRYLANGGKVGRDVIARNLPILKENSKRAIDALAGNEDFKRALRAAGATAEMQDAQNAVAFTRYLTPAIEACEGSGFTLPLSLAVIYDSINHGSYQKIRDQVRCVRSQFMSDAHFEKAWIGEYTERRDAWLRSVARLKATAYRTAFFLTQIRLNNWRLKLPLRVQGYLLTDSVIEASGETPSANPQTDQSKAQSSASSDAPPAAEPQSPNTEDDDGFSIGDVWGKAVDGFDRVTGVADVIATRKAAAKALLKVVVSAVSQAFWWAASIDLGLPWWVWAVVASGLVVFGLFYTYRHFSLGKRAKRQQAALFQK